MLTAFTNGPVSALTIVRIVADDLTGALDSAAPLARRTGA